MTAPATRRYDEPYDDAVLDRLPSLAAAIGLLYLGRCIPYVLVYDGGTLEALVVLTAITSAVLMVLAWLAQTRRLPASAWQHGAGVIILVVAVETMLRVWITDEAWQTMDLMLAIIAAAATMNSARWFVVTVSVNWLALAGAFALAWPIQPETPGDRIVWPYVLLATATSTLLAAVFRASRMAALHSMNEARSEAVQMAVADQLTGLANRRGLEIAVVRVAATARRAGEPVHCVFVDVDGFKQVNDSAGHAVGDAVLVSVAAALRAVTRPDDVVARWAGDEFVVLGVGGGTGAAELERRMAQELSRSEHVPGVWPGVISAGAAVTPPDVAADLDELLRVADGDMYRRREERRGVGVPRQSPRVG